MKSILPLAALILLAAAVPLLAGCGSSTAASGSAADASRKPVTLLNVSYDPTRELYEEFNADFAKSLSKRRLALPSRSSNRTAEPASRLAR
jgi:ABC-type sulfate transport system substrate-binding protein